MLFASNKIPGVSFPPGTYGQRPWHEFLYDVKRKLVPEFPELSEALDWFDWDDPYPTNPDAARMLHLIASMRCDCELSSGRMKPRDKITSKLPPAIAEKMLEIAKAHKEMLILQT